MSDRQEIDIPCYILPMDDEPPTVTDSLHTDDFLSHYEVDEGVPIVTSDWMRWQHLPLCATMTKTYGGTAWTRRS